jgi:peptidoglycan/xylan/chitin deacetylase (PgdA/CDA1 family)
LTKTLKTILMYHQIDDVPPGGTPFRGLTVPPKNFKNQMYWLARLGYRGLSLRELAPYIKDKTRDKVVGITFDDGFQNVHRHALPVLQELGFTATCFFVSGQIGGYNKWDEAIGIPYAPCMSRSEVLEWARAGNEIGAHTIDHVYLTRVEPAEAFRQIRDSRRQLEDMAGESVLSFCYPHGDVSRIVRDMAEKSGYTLATTTRRARASQADDPLLLPRRNVRHSDGFIATLRKSAFG